MDKHSPSTRTYHGSCHCGALRFEVDLDLAAGVSRCNCTICTKVGSIGAVAKPQALRALSDETALGQYEWGGRTATRYFCQRCGIHGYLRGNLPELGGAYVSINLNCLDDLDVGALKPVHWDGRHDNWDAGPRDTPWPRGAAA